VCSGVGAMPRPPGRWPQMLGHRPSAPVVRSQALAGRLHRSLPVAGRAPPQGGDRCPDFLARHRARTTARAPRRPRLRFPSMPYVAQRRQRPGGVRSFGRMAALRAHTPHQRSREDHSPPTAPLPSMPSPRSHFERSRQVAATASRRAFGRPLVVGGRQGTEGKRSRGRLVANRGSAGAVGPGAWGVGRLIPACGGFRSPPRARGRDVWRPRRGWSRDRVATAPRDALGWAARRRVSNLVRIAGTFRRSCSLARARARTTARGPRRRRLRFPSVPSPRSATNARGCALFRSYGCPLSAHPPPTLARGPLAPHGTTKLPSPSMPSPPTHPRRPRQAAATATRRACGRP
jgi:hypothetical protein